MLEPLGWLMEGDPAIRWQVGRDLLGWSRRRVATERKRVASEGWGEGLLKLQDPSGTWAQGLYTPKWTSTTYTLLLLRRLGLPARHPAAVRGLEVLLDAGLKDDGDVNFWRSLNSGDTCVTAMMLALGARFMPGDERLERIASRLLKEQMRDGGWNCERKVGATHASVHTTVSVLEALLEYEEAGGQHAERAARARARGAAFFARHRLYKSHRTGQPMNERFTKLSFPPRWHFDILRGLDYLRAAGAERDSRFGDAIEVLRSKRRADGTWPVQHRHQGKVFFHMEKTGGPSRWNTLRALRVLDWWEGDAG